MADSQLDLFAPPAQHHSATSEAAGLAIRHKAPRLREIVLEYIRAHPGATDEEIAAQTGLNPSTARPRRVELERAGLIAALRIPGTTSAGRKATRWRAVP